MRPLIGLTRRSNSTEIDVTLSTQLTLDSVPFFVSGFGRVSGHDIIDAQLINSRVDRLRYWN